MSNKILVMSRSGAGKTTSLRTLDPKQTCIINVTGKALPFPGWKKQYSKENGNLFCVYDHEKILKILEHVNLKKPEIKTIVIDDAQYIMSYEFMERAGERGFDKFVDIAEHMFKVIKRSDELREDLTVVFLTHSEDISVNGYTLTKMKTIGKMLDDKITLEGLFTVVLMAEKITKGEEKKHYFITQSDGTTTVKTPMGMFDSLEIPNDMQFVLDSIKKYNEGE